MVDFHQNILGYSIGWNNMKAGNGIISLSYAGKNRSSVLVNLFLTGKISTHH